MDKVMEAADPRIEELNNAVPAGDFLLNGDEYVDFSSTVAVYPSYKKPGFTVQVREFEEMNRDFPTAAEAVAYATSIVED